MVRGSFGKNYTRLVELKNRYDAANLFRLNQNIQPTAPKAESQSPIASR
jgi:hypothetical protein